MAERTTHSYRVKTTDWHTLAGRGRGVLVKATWDRHKIGDVVLIYTQGVGEASHLEAAEHWKVIGKEGSVGASLTALIVRRAKLEEVLPPELDPTTMTEPERMKEASRQVYEILSDLTASSVWRGTRSTSFGRKSAA
ncbi:hypothetical protein AFCDBAGC_1044 [Methylobacterium cerastii]|uniref:EVE domain-containing protein n=1 Tax=Methylobacterium cerastii TaxID=932741 RepID=A0ABQ4QDA5_9HYPH|nr:hypothetical protein [Methylobacterium cerastii]GJD43197.1 hypothetical protein AFCDBAGC_1044 [Methylobacterium cerastii]